MSLGQPSAPPDPPASYEAGYRACDCFWGDSPGSLVEELGARVALRGLRVLDVGAGEGKNAYYCARAGASVDAIELSAAAIANGQRHFGRDSRVRWICADAVGYELDEPYDIVISYGFTHCLSDRGAIVRLLERLKRATRAGGYHVVCAFNSRRQELQMAHPGFDPSLLTHDEYVEVYRDWDVLISRDADLREAHPHNGIWHTHSLTRLLARRLPD